jgi:starch phosphorylase
VNKEELKNSLLYGFLASEIEGMELLMELALDLRWSWNHAADALWRELDDTLWETTANPWIILQTVSRTTLEQKLTNGEFRAQLDTLIQERERSLTGPAWFQLAHPKPELNTVAYFSMEYMLSDALPIYVGGLGNVAGDQLKSASDLGVPLVAIGLLYQQGYFRQEFDHNGDQQARFPVNDPGQLPIRPLRLENGEWLRLEVRLGEFTVWLRTWQVQVGRVWLYLLDSNDMVNQPAHRSITNAVYGGGSDLRIQQEIILGIGGWKLVKALGINPELCHLNEGHAAFVILERARDFMQQNGVDFNTALAVTRAGNLFTTHTAVAAGFDHFDSGLMAQFFQNYAQEELAISLDDLLALGRLNPANRSESFNMALLAFRGSGAVNAVSRLHGQVSRRLFEPMFPRWPRMEVPVGYVTNGVHMPTWDSEQADQLWTKACGKDRWRGEQSAMDGDIARVSDEALWNMRNSCRTSLVDFTRKSWEQQLKVEGQPHDIQQLAREILHEGTLTLGFARRFVPYKRPTLLLHDEARLIRLLTNPERPVQLVLAGKAPPFDETGKALIRQWVQFVRRHALYRHVVFLSDYDVLMAQHLVQGADVWLNTPRRPWEASGTSGMKVLVNGGLNLSVLDGWWAEAYMPGVGWALGDKREHGDDPVRDAAEAEALYLLLENQVIPEFYERDARGVPVGWVARIRQSMSILTPRFSANRTVREYTENHYLPMAANYLHRAAGKGEVGKKIIRASQAIRDNWGGIAWGELTVDTEGEHHLFCVQIYLNSLSLNLLSVELYAENSTGDTKQIIPMTRNENVGETGGYVTYQAVAPASRPADDFTVRILPTYEGISVPLEDQHILWHH